MDNETRSQIMILPLTDREKRFCQRKHTEPVGYVMRGRQYYFRLKLRLHFASVGVIKAYVGARANKHKYSQKRIK